MIVPLATTELSAPRPPLRALIVESTPSRRAQTARCLRRRYGAEVQIAEADGGDEALRMLTAAEFDVALIGEHLADSDPNELASRIRRFDAGAAPVMIPRRAGKAAADAPPVRLTPVRLAQAVDAALSDQRLRRQNARLAEQLSRTQAHMDHLLRALSHDMGANCLLLAQSVKTLTHSWAPALPAAAEAAAHVEACLRGQQRFIEDLRQLGQTGDLDMSPQRVSLEQTAQEVLYELKDALHGRGVRVDIDPPLPAVWCHPQRVRQVLFNLFRNALIHGCDAAEPRLILASAPPALGQAAPHRVWLRVQDNGRGIPPAWRQEIFLPGKRLAEAGEGSGMGLAIVKRIIDHYDGTIEVIDANGPGACFRFSLPAPPPHAGDC